MLRSELENFGKYEVYEIVNKKKHTICVFNEFKLAEAIAILLANSDPKEDAYHISSIDSPDTFTMGGGWRITYKKNKNGKVIRSEIS